MCRGRFPRFPNDAMDVGIPRGVVPGFEVEWEFRNFREE